MKLVQENSLRYLIWLGLIIPATFSLSACSKSDDGSDLADAVTTTPEKAKFLRDFFNGNSDKKSLFESAANTQRTLLMAILAVVVLILIVVTIRLFTNKKTD